MYCPQCKIITTKPTCPKCSNVFLLPDAPAAKNRGVSAVLSFFIPGLGQFYNEQIVLGLVFIFLYAFFVGAGFVFTVVPEDIWLFLIPAVIIWLISLVQAYNRAKWMRQEARVVRYIED